VEGLPRLLGVSSTVGLGPHLQLLCVYGVFATTPDLGVNGGFREDTTVIGGGHHSCVSPRKGRDRAWRGRFVAT